MGKNIKTIKIFFLFFVMVFSSPGGAELVTTVSLYSYGCQFWLIRNAEDLGSLYGNRFQKQSSSSPSVRLFHPGVSSGFLVKTSWGVYWEYIPPEIEEPRTVNFR